MLISVAVPVPALPLLTYRLPPESPAAVRGARVLVPLGRRTVTGIVVGPAEGPEPDGVRDATEILDATPFLPGEVVNLAHRPEWAPTRAVLRQQLDRLLTETGAQ